MSKRDTGSTIIEGTREKKEYEKGVLSFLDIDREIKILWATELMLGRDSASDISFKDNRISRKHAVVQLEYDAAKFVDLNSSNGSSRNGEPVEGTIILNDGDIIKLGGAIDIEVRLREEADAVKSILLKHGKTEYLLTQSEVFIGRHPEASDIQIDDVLAGSLHAQLEFVFDDAIITCLDDEKNLLVGGEITKSVQLDHYAEIQIGNTRMAWKY